MCTSVSNIGLGTWHVRINREIAQTLRFTAVSNPASRSKTSYHYEAPFAANEAKAIAVYYQGNDMKASDMYEVSIEFQLDLFKPITVGTCDVSQTSLDIAAPPFLARCKNGVEAKIVVRATIPPLAYKTAGVNFDRFMADLTFQWRAHAMTMVKDGMARNKIDENKSIGSGQMFQVIDTLNKHMKSEESNEEFEKSFGAIKL